MMIRNEKQKLKSYEHFISLNFSRKMVIAYVFFQDHIMLRALLKCSFLEKSQKKEVKEEGTKTLVKIFP